MDLNQPIPYKSAPNIVRTKVNKSPLKILIVDDERLVRETLKEYLHALGSFEVYLAENAFEGLNTIHRLGGGLDGVLVDINMPGMDGIEFVKRVKKKDRSIVAIIITGYPSSEKVIQAMRAGASDFLAKPFSLDQLSVSLERLAGERKVLKENVYLSRELQVKKALEETNQKLQQKVKEQAILFTISDTLSKTKSTKELYNTLVELACTLTQTEQGLFWVINRDEQKMILMASKGLYDPELETIHYPDSPLPYAQVAKDGIPTLIPAVDGAKRDAALIAIPLFIQKNIFGVLSIACPRPGVILEDDAVFILHLLTERASLTIENLLLYESVSYNLYSTLTALVSTLEAKDSYTKALTESDCHFHKNCRTGRMQR
ncbi:Acetoacetate metabolism regulatory protein AtoC [Dissulfuribacter thermophilus]|uniref:Acetoacetate metabolism regulatory protein AtoC n=1 Tax=Dissulfuribacter thermophilus TaxID=1156395 RepID=A0A1B9F423_9BACT|nr:response regulator [Dissulfuribacter thermophilus]OCC14699.1 Acetoacetate metabolism regulatory protein AtoC [Dissulfuribacter thermophilus]